MSYLLGLQGHRLMQCKSVCSLAAIRLRGTSCGSPTPPPPSQPLFKYLSSSLLCSRLTPAGTCVVVRVATQ